MPTSPRPRASGSPQALDESEERAAEAIVRVAELEQENDVLHSENDVLRAEIDAHTSWHPEVRHA